MTLRARKTLLKQRLSIRYHLEFQFEFQAFPFILTMSTVKLGSKERFDKEQIGLKELFMDYQPFYTINLLLDKELLPI